MEPLNLNIIRVLEDYKNGAITASEAARKLEAAPAEAELPGAIIDLAREKRAGFPEAIYAAGKTPQQVCDIFAKMMQLSGRALATRCSEETMQLLEKLCPEATVYRSCGVAVGCREVVINAWAKVAVLAAGTSDLPVAEEAALTLEFCGYNPDRVYDVGVAGIHRLLGRMERFADADAVIVVAGMEGALPSVVGGLVGCPVIAVPTSVGYGTSFNGIAALLGMLNSCSAGISVVNIDNGFGAAAAAVRILKGKKT